MLGALGFCKGYKAGYGYDALSIKIVSITWDREALVYGEEDVGYGSAVLGLCRLEGLPHGGLKGVDIDVEREGVMGDPCRSLLFEPVDA